jgi:hypothetical protein
VIDLGSALILINLNSALVVIVWTFRRANILSFQTPAFEKKDRPSPSKKFHFFRSRFSCEKNRQPTIKFDIDLEVLLFYRLIPRKLGFPE